MVEAFIKNFVYSRGVRFLDGYRMIADKPVGDCDDYAITVLYLLEKRSWLKTFWSLLTFKAVIWMVRSKSNKFFPSHAVLYYRGLGWTDSTVTAWRPTAAPHRLQYPFLFPWVALRVLWGMTIGKLFP